MKVTLKRVDDGFHFEALGASSPVVNHLDAAEDIGGHNLGARPMEMLLMGLGGCTAIDVILILKKHKQVIEDFQIELTGEREQIEGTMMKPFTAINIHFMVKGSVDEQKLEKAIALSMEKYCSATAQLRPSAVITHSFEIN